VIPKPAITQWLARPTKLGDINGDGRLDIVGMLIHDEKGNLPADKAEEVGCAGRPTRTPHPSVRPLSLSRGAILPKCG